MTSALDKYQVVVGTTTYPFKSLYYKRGYKFERHPFEAVLPFWDNTLVGGENATIYRNGAAVTHGKLWAVSPKKGDEGVEMVLKCFTDEKGVDDMEASARTQNQDPRLIIEDQIYGSPLDQGTLNTYGSSIAMEFGTNDYDIWTRTQVINEIPAVIGWEIYVRPDSKLDFKLQCGTDRSSTILFGRGLIKKWIKPPFVNQLNKVTKVVVNGGLEGDFQAYGIAGSGTTVRKITRKNLINNTTCGLMAAALLADFQNDVITGIFECIDTYVGAAYDVYDTVHVEDPEYGIDANYRIYEIERWVDAQNGERTQIYITNITKLTGNGPLLIDSGEELLKSGQVALRYLGTSRINNLLATALNASRQLNLESTDVIGKIPGTKLADLAVGEDHLANGAVTVNKIGDLAVSGAKIALLTINHSHIETKGIYGSNINDSTIEAQQIANSTIIGSKIDTKTITNSNIADSTINVAEKAVIGSVSNSIIAGQAVSIDKVNANVGADSVSVLYAKWMEYTRTATYDITGAKIYTRTIPADTKMKYRIKQIVFLLKGTRAFCDVYINNNGTHNTIIADTDWVISNVLGGGKTRWLDVSAGTAHGYRGGGGSDSSQSGANDADHLEIYKNLTTENMSTYVQMKIAIGDASHGTVTIRCEISDGGYYEKTGVDLSTIYKTKSINLVDFSLVGAAGSGWASIGRVRIIYPNTFNVTCWVPRVWFTTTTVYTYEVNDPSNYAEYDSTEITVDLAVNTACVIDYWLGNGAGNAANTAYLEYPASDIRSRNYLEDLTA